MKKRILFILTLFLSGCSPLKFVYSEENLLEYGSDPLSLVLESNADQIDISFFDNNNNPVQEENLKINEEYLLVFDVTKGKLKKQFEKTVLFCDTQAPIASPQSLTLQLEYGAEFDSFLWLQENLFLEDNFTTKDKLIIEGIEQLTSKQEGTFILIIKDECQNSTQISIQVILTDTTPPIITATKTTFSIDEQIALPDFPAMLLLGITKMKKWQYK